MRTSLGMLLVVAMLLGACAPGRSLNQTPTSTPGSAFPTEAAPIPPPPSGISRALTIWLPSDLSPDGPGEAAALLTERLQSFTTAHPGARLQVRIKGNSGPAGMMNSLNAAQQAAPSVLPDLVALDAPDLVTAAAGELIVSWQQSGTVPEAWGLAESVQASARVQDLLAGLPFAVEADLFAIDPLAYPSTPYTWADLLTANAAFLLPLGDPSAQFTLGQYLAAGGMLRDAEGAPVIDRLALQEVLAFYAAGRAAGLLPLTSRQHEDFSTTGEALLAGKIDAGVIPFSHFSLAGAEGIVPVGPWPTSDGAGTCFLRAWTWALPARPAGPEPLAIDLAMWLADPEFSGPWARALGLIPAGTAALATWPDDNLAALAGLLASRCAPLPPPEDLALFGPILRQAAEAALTGELTPEAAAARAVQSLPPP